MADGKVTINTALDNTGFKKGVSNLSGELGGLKNVLGKIGTAVGIAFSVAAIVSFWKASVTAATELTNAMTGLQSVVEGQGRSFSQAQEFINSYTQDGLIPATEAITSYKNLALRGYDDSQIQQVMTALKDSAAFGRQSSYTLGQAVKSATEGLKNKNSILVDNAGVTKNVAKMWEDYAKSIGTTSNNLTQQQKIQAEVSGILEESKYQTGDAAKVANSYSGQVMKMQFAFNNLKVAMGNAIIPIAQAVLPSINAIITGLTKILNVFSQVSSALFGTQVKQQEAVATTATAGAKAEDSLAKSTTAAGKAAKKAQAGFDELNVLQENTAVGTSGSDASGAEAATFGIAGSGEIGKGTTVSEDVTNAINTVKVLLKPLQAINFDNLKKAFENLKTAVEPITETLFAGLKWAWDNVFVPFSTWVIEDAFPAWLDATSSQFDALNAIIEALKPLGTWLWETFLKPFLSWAGDRYIDWLTMLKDGFTAISDWINNNKTLVQDIVIVIGAFAAAWGIANLAFTIAGIVSALVAFVATGGLASAVATILGGAIAFFTSPIMLVALAIGALIAIVVLMVKHWDEIKAAAETCWAKICEVWGVVAGWFNTKVIQPVVGFFMGLWNNITGIFQSIINWVRDNWVSIVAFIINPFAGVFTYLYENFEGFRDFVDGIVKKVGEFFAGLWKGIQNGFINMINFLIGGINTLIDGFLFPINALISGWNNTIGKVTGTIPQISIQIPRIPKLAQGAVIPPNREFMAVLGDQKSGTNIEAPLDTIKQAFAEVMAQSGSDRSGDLLLQVDGKTFARIIKPFLDAETNRRGTRLVTGGSY